MTSNRSNPFCVLALSEPSDRSLSVESHGHQVSITMTTDLTSLQRILATQSFDGLVLDGTKIGLEDLLKLKDQVNLSRMFLVAGPSSMLEAITNLTETSEFPKTLTGKLPNKELQLEDFLESKLERFIRAMKLSSARGLYSTFLRAVERPLIELALRETKGNQIKAAQLLGMNRNTLRKKIAAFRIPLTRRRPSARFASTVG